jgi:hypothetical protein
MPPGTLVQTPRLPATLQARQPLQVVASQQKPSTQPTLPTHMLSRAQALAAADSASGTHALAEQWPLGLHAMSSVATEHATWHVPMPGLQRYSPGHWASVAHLEPASTVPWST